MADSDMVKKGLLLFSLPAMIDRENQNGWLDFG